MKEIDIFRDIAARLDKYGLNILPDILDMYGLPPCEFPRLCEGKRFYLLSENGRAVLHRLDEWAGRRKFGESLKAAKPSNVPDVKIKIQFIHTTKIQNNPLKSSFLPHKNALLI